MQTVERWGPLLLVTLSPFVTRNAILLQILAPPHRLSKPVMLPPGCARFAAKPLPIGSDTVTNTDRACPRFAGSPGCKAMERELLREKHVMRYAAADDFGLPTTAFLICRFWLVDAW